MNNLCPSGHSYRGRRCPICNTTKRRGYDSKWRRLSERFRAENPLCEECDKVGRVTAAAHVHHRIPISQAPHLRLEWHNLQSLCVSCHLEAHDKEGIDKRDSYLE